MLRASHPLCQHLFRNSYSRNLHAWKDYRHILTMLGAPSSGVALHPPLLLQQRIEHHLDFSSKRGDDEDADDDETFEAETGGVGNADVAK